ncbi:hypothetical protein [Arthrobacter globiformis]|uniref:hypothetical protein n=1 Tax=Arthrobacter globiformis TaxID=1665 RepID=UPI0027920B86|nr:hypothetical protein [Arthrobacter globiformis]MDQ0616649.1 hypothetical protein [Arthrobacter globiformis]
MRASRHGIRPGWVLLGIFSVFMVPILLFFGIWVGGLDDEESCHLTHHQTYDREYRMAHPEHAGRNIFPLSNKCNADYDMVPFWMNPAIVGFALLTVGAFIVPPLRNRSARNQDGLESRRLRGPESR